jgi:hypothetical protein
VAEVKPLLIAKPRKPYVPILSAVERRAYHAAHRILTEPYVGILACPGGRRSAAADHMAQIIIEEFRGIGAKTPR